ncbi:MAG TPA: helix-turn-helix domain-containing protein [Solirubrobacteraceae bacterium]|nr:helix-turn-helix domain-containing protein [Solirubrobacteraceae bacterium]
MHTDGLRERKKRRTRELIASTAARLFAEHGYEQVSVLDVAAAAEVSEQTVYNHFPTKRALVLDRDEELRDRLTALIASRPSGVSPAAAIRDAALSMVAELRTMSDTQIHGGLGYLSVRSPAVRRLALEMTDRHADAIAAVLTDAPGGPSLAVTKVHAIALAWVFQTITDESGRGTAAGLSPAEIADALAFTVTAILDQLDAWPRLIGSASD